MKRLKHDSTHDEGYQILIQNLKQTSDDLKNVYNNLEHVVEPDLIDYYIYQAKAVQTRYKFLLNCVKKIEKGTIQD